MKNSNGKTNVTTESPELRLHTPAIRTEQRGLHEKRTPKVKEAYRVTQHERPEPAVVIRDGTLHDDAGRNALAAERVADEFEQRWAAAMQFQEDMAAPPSPPALPEGGQQS